MFIIILYVVILRYINLHYTYIHIEIHTVTHTMLTEDQQTPSLLIGGSSNLDSNLSPFWWCADRPVSRFSRSKFALILRYFVLLTQSGSIGSSIFHNVPPPQWCLLVNKSPMNTIVISTYKYQFYHIVIPYSYWSYVQQHFSTGQIAFGCLQRLLTVPRKLVWKPRPGQWHCGELLGPAMSFCPWEVQYPLVNIQKTMENHHFQWENPL